MRILARVLILPVALLLVALGAFALLAHYGSDTELADQARRGLQGLNRWANGQGAGLPRDFAVRVEEWTAGTFLRFAVLPLGVLAMAFTVGLIGGKAASSEEGAARTSDAPDDSQESVDKKGRKRLLKQAKAMGKERGPIEAAEFLWSHDLLEEAARIFIAEEEFTRAAEIRHDQNRFKESAELHLQGENFEAAGAIFAQQEDWGQAADCYLKADLKSIAAEMFEKAGAHQRAAECFYDSEFMRHAAANFVKCKAWQRAADCLEAVFVDEGSKTALDPKKQAEMTKLVRQAGKLYMKAGEPEKALSMFERGGCSLEAGEVAKRLGQHDRAAEHLRAAGEIEKAVQSLRDSGQEREAARVMGQHLRDAGQRDEAARYLEEAGDFMEAGDLYRSLEDFERAAECYEKHDGFAQSAEMFQLAGDRERAGAAFEKAGRFAEAAECFALAGSAVREAEMLEQAGEFLRAGETYHREKLNDEAVAVLQKLQQDDEGFARGAAILGDIFASRGELAIAIAKLQQAIGDTELSSSSIESYYRLATIYQEDGKAREAVEVYEKIMASDYNFRDVEERLAQVRSELAEGESVAGAAGMGGDGSEASQRSGKATEGARYKVVGEIGRGGMGIVYKVQDTVLDRVVAFKMLPQALTGNEQAISNFVREAQAAAKLNHPNIVTVYDTGELQGRYFIAMEYASGTTIKEILRRRGPIAPAGILHVLIQMGEALAYAHAQKVVHRDIKPANVMWTRDKKVKLMDFGLARVVEEARNHTTVVAGTPYYMSPEQTLGKNIDHRTDIYSLGVSLFEMATGRVPFTEGNIPYHHVHSAPPHVREVRPDVPESLAAIVERCLQKDPANRYQSAKELLAEARAALAG